jgi:hypothetical protein
MGHGDFPRLGKAPEIIFSLDPVQGHVNAIVPHTPERLNAFGYHSKLLLKFWAKLFKSHFKGWHGGCYKRPLSGFDPRTVNVSVIHVIALSGSAIEVND